MTAYLNTDSNGKKRIDRVLKGYRNDDPNDKNLNDPQLTLGEWYDSIIDLADRQSLRDESDIDIKHDLLSPPPGFHWTKSYSDDGIRRYGMGGITNYNIAEARSGNMKLDKTKKILLEIRKYKVYNYSEKDNYIENLKKEIENIGYL